MFLQAHHLIAASIIHPPFLPSSSLPPLREERNDESRRREFKTFQRSFLAVALLAMFSDWTQGPYSYALYAYYGYECAPPALPPSLSPPLRSFSYFFPCSYYLFVVAKELQAQLHTH